MSNSWFRFKQFTIHQESAAMKVGTDGVLLGAWASVPPPGSRILDVGTGTGLIALMIAQRTGKARVDGLEIDPASAWQARENFRQSAWKESLFCIGASFQEYSSRHKDLYDLIICNPPFFSASTPAPSRAKNLARHDGSLGLEELFSGSVALMKQTGLLSLILPAQKETRALDLVREHQLFCHRRTRVRPSPGKAFHRVLLECSFLPGPCREDELAIETGKRHQYSGGYQKLTEDFYLEPGIGSDPKDPDQRE
jgi:tRNA1Val (adenine37-N6)-methyltransferase